MSAMIAVGTTQGVYVLNESGSEWKLLGQGLMGRCVRCLKMSPSTSQPTLWAGLDQNGLASTSNLEEWHPAVNNLSGMGVHSLVFHPRQKSVMLVGTAPAALYLSLDGGQTFEEMPAFRKHPGASNWSYPEAPYRSRLHRLFLHPQDLDVVCAGVLSGGFYLSGDVGRSWQERNGRLGRQVHDLAQHPLLPGRLYGCSAIGFYVSENLGEQWVERNHGLAYLHTSVLAVHPDEPNLVFLGAHRNAAGGGSVFRTSDAGLRWQACEGLPFQPDLRYTAMALKGQTLMVGTSQGELFMSRDLGTTWGKIRSAMPPITCLSLIQA